MWFRKLVGFAMIISFVGINSIILFGLFSPPVEPAVVSSAQVDPMVYKPGVTITAKPGSIQANDAAGLIWKTTGSPEACMASGDWKGKKTPFGSESTGRLTKVRKYTFKITCTNEAGSASAKVSVNVTAAPPTSTQASAGSSSGGSSGGGSIYCAGRSPCYGPADLASHSSPGNCWGYNNDRVIDISSFDAGYHKSKTGISSIEVSGVCGTNLSSSLAGGVSADGQTRNHNTSTKTNADQSLIPYFRGYYDAAKK